MPARQPYQIHLTRRAIETLRRFTARERQIVSTAITVQLRYEPAVETRNRKQLRKNEEATWALRVSGNLRVLYDVEEDSRTVVARLVARKVGNRFYVDGELLER